MGQSFWQKPIFLMLVRCNTKIPGYWNFIVWEFSQGMVTKLDPPELKPPTENPTQKLYGIPIGENHPICHKCQYLWSGIVILDMDTPFFVNFLLPQEKRCLRRKLDWWSQEIQDCSKEQKFKKKKKNVVWKSLQVMKMDSTCVSVLVTWISSDSRCVSVLTSWISANMGPYTYVTYLCPYGDDVIYI